MQAAEIELKFPVADVNALQNLLPQLGFNLVTARTFEQNTLYDTPGRDLRGAARFFASASTATSARVTHKRMSNGDPVDTTRYKIRIETETIVAEGAALAEIFHQMGYNAVFVYEKYRTEWSFALGDGATAHLVIDETPIGNYAELEGPTDWIDRTLAQLGVSHDVCMTDSYGKLFLDWKQRTGSSAENLTFAEIGAPVLAPQ